MAGEKKIEKSEPLAPGLKSDPSAKLGEQDMASKKDGLLSESIPSGGNASSGIKGAIDQAPVAEEGVYYPPTSCYNYYYPGYNGTFSQLDDQAFFSTGGGSHNGLQAENGSLLYYMPGYNPYTMGYMGVDGKQPYVSSGYLQQPVSYGSDAMPYYAWDSTYTGNALNASAAKPGNTKSAVGNSSLKSNGFNSSKTNSNLSNKSSLLPLNSKARQFDASSNLSKSILQTQPLKPFNKLGSGYQSMGVMKGFHPVGKYSSFANQNHAFFMHYAPVNYQTNGRGWNGNNKYKSRGYFSRNGEVELSAELTRGPRGNSRSSSPKPSAEAEQTGLTVQKEKYNLDEFPAEYEDAKFYVIKSYSEDDIHKCIKYDVWSSTPNGNKKLSAAYRDAEAKASETGKKCPVFLFFSVNGSGQFLGVAEMIGHVDFNKNMDFWQLDKWNGFFPVKWHTIKDVPNTQLRHIILENNENRPVTYSRDTQEIGLKQGLEMLKIFKSYTAKTSLLDDFNFYEEREKSLKARRSSKPVTQTDAKNGEATVKVDHTDTAASLINLTENLSLNSQPLKGSV